MVVSGSVTSGTHNRRFWWLALWDTGGGDTKVKGVGADAFLFVDGGIDV